jgi:AcrR family transcriptional regulator
VSVPEPGVKPRRGRPAKTSKDDVVRVAREIVLSEGYDALSVRRIASELGVTPFTVQFQAGTKDELLDEVVTELLSERSFAPSAFRSWRKGLIHYGESMFTLLTEHPAICESLQRTAVAPATAMDALERVATLAERDGLGLEQIARYYDIVWAFVIGYASTLNRRDEASGRTAIARTESQHPRAAQLLHALSAEDRQDRFSSALAVLVASLGTA